ncbi:hypothetical protein RCL_jg7345.t1 [Rhizophagus clarus]|uniref:Uncharacterized protein n=1 Tax=Rhizophagus clarus TaxID=94130 RepID=A0A8H3L783_9GLOM|nr:hypothetical protein RCL_jg7345.t1 [Rhizophagus clarus]
MHNGVDISISRTQHSNTAYPVFSVDQYLTLIFFVKSFLTHSINVIERVTLSRYFSTSHPHTMSLLFFPMTSTYPTTLNSLSIYLFLVHSVK